ncbi:hypothetical protein GGF31_006482 [Allomyces arbusculus]|nr:hypothetical protein GGF31_006482 [Allomyces arbusculus]
MSVDEWTLFEFDYTPGFTTGCLIVADTYYSGDQFPRLERATVAAPALADNTTVDQWTNFQFGNVGSSTGTYSITLPKEGCLIVTDAYCSGDQFRVTVNGQDKGTFLPLGTDSSHYWHGLTPPCFSFCNIGLTSTPSATWCASQVGSDPDAALVDPAYSKGYFPINGASTFKITAARGQPGGAFFKVTSTTCPVQYKVVTSAGKVNSRAAAAAACEAAGMALADVTSANWNTVLDVVRASPDIHTNPMDAVVINSWNGDTYGGVNIQLAVTSTGGAVTLLTAPAYPLCQGTGTGTTTLAVSATSFAAKSSFAAKGAAPKDTRNGPSDAGK